MPNIGLYALSGLVRGAEKAATNIRSAKIKEREYQDKQKQDDLTMKINNLKLDKLENEMDPDILQGKRDLLKQQQKLQKSAYDLAQFQFNEIQKENKGTLKDNISSLNAFERTTGIEIDKIIPDMPFALGGGKAKKSTYTNDLRNTLSGQGMDTPTLKQTYPDKIGSIDKAIKNQSQYRLLGRKIIERPIEDNKQGGLLSKAKGAAGMVLGMPTTIGQSGMNEATKSIIKGIRTYKDLEDIFSRADDLDESIDVTALEKYYDAELNELGKAGILEQ